MATAVLSFEEAAVTVTVGFPVRVAAPLEPAGVFEVAAPGKALSGPVVVVARLSTVCTDPGVGQAKICAEVLVEQIPLSWLPHHQFLPSVRGGQGQRLAHVLLYSGFS
jgi:hypothetical protein